MFYTKQLQFDDVNIWALSALQNFLSKVFTFGMYYDKMLKAYSINDVLVQFFYAGKMTYLLLDFDKLVYDEEDPDLDWETYMPYVPPNKRDRQYYIDRGLPLPEYLQQTPSTEVKDGQLLVQSSHLPKRRTISIERQYEQPLKLDLGSTEHEPFVLDTMYQILLILSQMKTRKEMVEVWEKKNRVGGSNSTSSS